MKQLELFEAFARQPLETITRTSMKRSLREQSNNAIALAIAQWKREGIVKERQVGRTGLLSLDLRNNLTNAYLMIANIARIGAPALKAIELVRQATERKTPFYSIVLFGSHAAGTQQKGSDIDIAIFVETKAVRQQVEAALHNVKLVADIDAQTIAKDEFIAMLTNGEENLGIQIAKKHRAIHNPQAFYSMILEAQARGYHP